LSRDIWRKLHCEKFFFPANEKTAPEFHRCRKALFLYQVSSEKVWDAQHSLEDLFIWFELIIMVMPDTVVESRKTFIPAFFGKQTETSSRRTPPLQEAAEPQRLQDLY
jgi:hypothetical protein